MGVLVKDYGVPAEQRHHLGVVVGGLVQADGAQAVVADL